MRPRVWSEWSTIVMAAVWIDFSHKVAATRPRSHSAHGTVAMLASVAMLALTSCALIGTPVSWSYMITFGRIFSGSLSATADWSLILFFISSKSIQACSGFGGGARPLVAANSLISSMYFATANSMASPSFSRSLHMMNASVAATATFAVNAADCNDCMPATADLHVHWK